jgi:hypothetical protein
MSDTDSTGGTNGTDREEQRRATELLELFRERCDFVCVKAMPRPDHGKVSWDVVIRLDGTYHVGDRAGDKEDTLKFWAEELSRLLGFKVPVHEHNPSLTLKEGRP